MGSTPGVSDWARALAGALDSRKMASRRTRVLLARDLDLDVGVVRRRAAVLVDGDLDGGLLPLGEGQREALVGDVAQLGVVARAHLDPHADDVRPGRRALGRQVDLLAAGEPLV